MEWEAQLWMKVGSLAFGRALAYAAGVEAQGGGTGVRVTLGV